MSVSLHPYQHSGLLVFLVSRVPVKVSTWACNMCLPNEYGGRVHFNMFIGHMDIISSEVPI